MTRAPFHLLKDGNYHQMGLAQRWLPFLSYALGMAKARRRQQFARQARQQAVCSRHNSKKARCRQVKNRG
jgi:hypothetical protein